MTRPSARDWYRSGSQAHYERHGGNYRNPHASIVEACVARAFNMWTIDASSTFDLAAGSGEVTRAILAVKPEAKVAACDPFTFAAYEREVGAPCERVTFEAVAAGGLRGRRFSLIACSFAMHLCPASILPSLCVGLAQLAPHLLILTPHKRPILREAWGVSLVDEFLEQRVRARLYTSTIVT